MKLRFAVADGTSQHLGNLAVLISFNVVQHEDDAIAGRKAFDGAFENHTVDGTRKNLVLRTEVLLRTTFFVGLQSFFERNLRESLLSDIMRTTLTVRRCSQVENAESPRKVPILRKSRRKAS